MEIALKLAQDKLPVKTEFINTRTPPRLGSIVSADLVAPGTVQPAALVEDGVAVDEILAEEEKLEDVAKGLEGLVIPPSGGVEARV